MNIIAAADKNWGIGYKGNLLTHIKEDMLFFKEKTINKAVIMGKETFLSLPGQKPLPDRKNFVLTTNKYFKAEGAEVCSSIEEALSKAKENFKDEDIFFIGGERVYRESEKFCDTAYITKIDKEFEADRFLNNYDENDSWVIKEEEMIKTEKGLYITFTTYKKAEH